MPMDRSLYPDDWEAIALAVKTAANWTCEQCCRPCRKPGEDFASFLERINWLFFDDDDDKPGRYILTVAHLNHIPSDCRPENLKALCSGCHLRYDTSQMSLKRRLKRERLGQLNLLMMEGDRH
jgi:hypothetical protein